MSEVHQIWLSGRRSCIINETLLQAIRRANVGVKIGRGKVAQICVAAPAQKEISL